MRKCQSCGYLVLGDGDTCKHCDAPLPPAPLPRAAATAPVLVQSASPPPPKTLLYDALLASLIMY